MSQLAKLDKEKVKLEGPFAEEILAAMKRLGMRRLEEFADTFGLGRTTVYNLVLGRKVGNKWIKPSLDTVVKLSTALNIPVEELIAKLYENEMPLVMRQEVQVPILGYVGAGPSQAEEIEERTVPVRVKGSARHLAAFVVRGNSMCAGRRPICDGDIVIVNTEDKGHPGAIVVARLQNGEYVAKLLKNGLLVSANLEENHGPPVIPASEVAEIVGRVVEVRSRVD
ncbi:LexA family transcriptional regulator [Thermus sp. PS18]|uniref:helix-turn-helix domain-containing protein n=1 Tax=Thermus sp. PS18 TaxID=2849039 RepID=UPI0022650A7B|nr:LexA family transcriptional regulator [Thermus sp. PS18]UZX15028.1 LexA family transcriptional regulator [Thermus sp. PS18]